MSRFDVIRSSKWVPRSSLMNAVLHGPGAFLQPWLLVGRSSSASGRVLAQDLPCERKYSKPPSVTYRRTGLIWCLHFAASVSCSQVPFSGTARWEPLCVENSCLCRGRKSEHGLASFQGDPSETSTHQVRRKVIARWEKRMCITASGSSRMRSSGSTVRVWTHRTQALCMAISSIAWISYFDKRVVEQLTYSKKLRTVDAVQSGYQGNASLGFPSSVCSWPGVLERRGSREMSAMAARRRDCR